MQHFLLPRRPGQNSSWIAAQFPKRSHILCYLRPQPDQTMELKDISGLHLVKVE